MSGKSGGGFVIKISTKDMTYETMMNFEKLVASKGDLIKMSFDIYDLPMEYDDDDLIIRWFEHKKDADQRVAIPFIKALMERARTHKVVSEKPLVTNNPYRSFYRFLFYIGLGGRGEKNKWLRKELLKNMKGCHKKIPIDETERKVYRV